MPEPTSLAEVVRRQLEQARTPVTSADAMLKDRVALRLLAEGVEELLTALEDNARGRAYDDGTHDRVNAAMLQLVAMGVRVPPETLKILTRRRGE